MYEIIFFTKIKFKIRSGSLNYIMLKHYGIIGIRKVVSKIDI